MKRTPHVLIILDGWGYSETSESNAIKAAHTPTWDYLWQHNPKTLISGSGLDVGLPEGQMGNSEVGHMNLGAGRILYQDFTKITKAIEDKTFFQNDALIQAIDQATSSGKAIHIFGLCSNGGVHSHENHIKAMIEMAIERNANKIYLHAFTDGRDTPPRSAESSLDNLDDLLRQSGKGHIASLSGRYFAMDRDNRWERIQAVYDMLTQGKADYQANNAIEALHMAYDRNENDEFIKPTIIDDFHAIQDGDSIIFMNFRADRARQITRAFTDKNFSGFARHFVPKLSSYVCLTQYAADINAPCAFPPEFPQNTIGEYCASLGKTQLRIAETEKYAHVTFFFSGGREALFEGETRELIPSPQVATYDLKPEMSAPEVTEKLCAAIRSGRYDLIICNYANGDMVGHTGVFDAAVKAAEALDHALADIQNAIIEMNGHCLITADHGNIEQMHDACTGQAHTAHTCEAVPLVYIGNQPITFKHNGILADIAPTLLELMALEPPQEMTGRSLIVH